MSRIHKYRESLCRFIKDKSCFSESLQSPELFSFVYSAIKDDDMIFPILLLTIMNNQNKKNHVSMQGYYLATCIESLVQVQHLFENKNDIINKFNMNNFYKMHTSLNSISHKSLQQNLDSIKNVYISQNVVDVIINSMSSFNDCLTNINNYYIFDFWVTDKLCNKNVATWYIKGDVETRDKFMALRQISVENMAEYIQYKYVNICELSIALGWIVGGGNSMDIDKLKNTAKSFAYMYKISKDFENIDMDLKNSDGYTCNYVLNFGLQDSYELFLNCKQSFIEEAMIGDFYTNTIKEIIDIIEAKIDIIIDQTSPDLKSNYSK